MSTVRPAGLFEDRRIAGLMDAGAIRADSAFAEDQIQPASLDLRCGRRAWRIRASFLPSADHPLEERLQDLALHRLDLAEGAVLETGCVYIVELSESLALPKEVYGQTNPKSSTGRLDIFTRVLADQTPVFDHIPAGYAGRVWLEISPRTFPVLVRTGSRLTQLRLRHAQAGLDMKALRQAQKEHQLVVTGTPDISERGIAVSVDLSGPKRQRVGYRAKRHSAVIDVDRKAELEIEEFWEPVYARGKAELILDPDEFYILASKEAVHVPPHLAAEMVPFDPLVGEFRVHYAGFFDPGFGHAPAGGHGARAVLEVRSREVPFILEDGQIVGRLMYEHLAATPEHLYGQALKSHYQAQGLKLSKHFRAPD